MPERKRVTDAELERVQTVFAGWGASLHGISIADIVADLRDLRKAAAPFAEAWKDAGHTPAFDTRLVLCVRAGQDLEYLQPRGYLDWDDWRRLKEAYGDR